MAYELNGRVAQKQRTRDALIAAARQLVADGMTPTVEAAAEAASISRTTAYRYFPSQRALLAAAHPETAIESMLPEDAPEDVEARVALVVAQYTEMIAGTEAQQRTMLRLSLEADPVERSQLPLRQGRVIKWLEEALAPLEADMPEVERHRLALAIRSATGIEALVWLTDVAGLPRDEAIELMRWSAGAMLSAALDDHATGAASKRGRAERGRRGRRTAT
ncbi:MAG TPA: TetR family transcriptional regulator [Acidimicrobiales bacterium]|nr:TetR family transcriptional regulator [Acidimicrobiales bacterium]